MGDTNACVCASGNDPREADADGGWPNEQY